MDALLRQVLAYEKEAETLLRQAEVKSRDRVETVRHEIAELDKQLEAELNVSRVSLLQERVAEEENQARLEMIQLESDLQKEEARRADRTNTLAAEIARIYACLPAPDDASTR